MSDYESRPGCGGYERKALDLYAAVVDDESLSLEEAAFMVACVRSMDGATGEVPIGLAKLRRLARLKSDKVTRDLVGRPHILKYFGRIESIPGRETRLWFRSGITRKFPERYAVGAVDVDCTIIEADLVGTVTLGWVANGTWVTPVRRLVVGTWADPEIPLQDKGNGPDSPTEHVGSEGRASAPADRLSALSSRLPDPDPAGGSAPVSASASGGASYEDDEPSRETDDGGEYRSRFGRMVNDGGRERTRYERTRYGR